jgi:hypothetical protein
MKMTVNESKDREKPIKEKSHADQAHGNSSPPDLLGLHQPRDGIQQDGHLQENDSQTKRFAMPLGIVPLVFQLAGLDFDLFFLLVIALDQGKRLANPS